MAKDYLTIFATSTPIERVFSGGTDLVAQRRCSLKGETIHEAMCLKGWLKTGLGEIVIENLEDIENLEN